jgi:hypothetical protein
MDHDRADCLALQAEGELPVSVRETSLILE